jgi:thioredoxin reductase
MATNSKDILLMYDAIVIGGSYAGLSAALQLARARRKVAVIDGGKRRNRFAHASHGFLGQDGRAPADIVSDGRAQLLAYPTVEWIDGLAGSASGGLDGFVVTTGGGDIEGSRLILATGVIDDLPDIPGLAERWGRSVFHCPYCHGYELGGGEVGVLAVSPLSLHQALMLPDWGRTTLFLNGAFEPDAEQTAELERRNVAVEREPIVAVGGSEADLELRDGRVVHLSGLFVMSRTRPSSPLAEQLGCAFDEGPMGPFVRTDGFKETTIAGVFAGGDAARATGSVAFATADGAMSGISAHQSLIFRK